MDYKDFNAHDFLEDEYFVEWVVNPDQESDHFWQKWITTNPDKFPEIERAKELIVAIKYKNRFQLSEQEYSSIVENILRANHSRNNRRFIWQPKYTYRVAASIILVLAAALVLLYPKNEPAYEARLLSTITENGQKKTVTLSDGSKIILNAGSSLQYPDRFIGDERKVNLQGEAFFEVVKDLEKPFIIQAHNLTTKVLGTSFNIRSYQEDDRISVSVVTGKVEISGPAGEGEILLPSDMGIFDKSKMDIRKTSFNPDKLIGWTTGNLIFENETLPSIFHKLERWYGVTIQVNDGLILEGRYSGQYKDKSLDLVLRGISYTSDFSFTINQKTVKIYEKAKN